MGGWDSLGGGRDETRERGTLVARRPWVFYFNERRVWMSTPVWTVWKKKGPMDSRKAGSFKEKPMGKGDGTI